VGKHDAEPRAIDRAEFIEENGTAGERRRRLDSV
jgi:hypothetical protein